MKLHIKDEEEQLRRRPRSAYNFHPLGLGGGEAPVPEPEPSDPIGDTLRADVVAYWKMDENGNDASGRGNDLTLVNSPSFAAGKVGNALVMTSASEQGARLDNNADIQLANGDYSIAFWLRLSSKDADQTILEKISLAFDYEYSLFYEIGNDRLNWYVGITKTTANNLGSPSINTWYFVVVDYDISATTATISINRATADSRNNVLAVSVTDGPLTIGYEDTYSYLDGAVDEMLFVKRLLTTEEKDYLYNSGNGRTLYP